MFQVQASWRETPTIVGAFQTLQEGYEACHTYSEKNPCETVVIFEQSPEASNMYMYDIKTGNLMEKHRKKVLLTKHENLHPIYDEISIVHDQLNTFNDTIKNQIDKLRGLFDRNAQNTKAPISLSVLLHHPYHLNYCVHYTTHEPNMKALLEELKEKLLSARYLSGQLDEWIYDLMLEVGETEA